jgi:hypothetical protein
MCCRKKIVIYLRVFKPVFTSNCETAVGQDRNNKASQKYKQNTAQ